MQNEYQIWNQYQKLHRIIYVFSQKNFIENQPVGDHGHFFRETSLRGSTGEFVEGNFFPENIDDSMQFLILIPNLIFILHYKQLIVLNYA